MIFRITRFISSMLLPCEDEGRPDGPALACGPAGNLDFPAHIKSWHEGFLTGSIPSGGPLTEGFGAIIKGMRDNTNPYEAAFSYDPETDLEEAQATVDTAIAEVNAMDPQGDYETFADTVLEVVEGVILSDEQIGAIVTNFETRQEPVLYRSMNRFSAQMDMGYVQASNSNWMGAFAIIEDGFDARVSDLEARLKGQNQQQKAALVAAGIAEMEQAQARKVAAVDAMSARQMGMDQMKIIAMVDKLANDLDLDVRDYMFDLSLFDNAARFVSALNGAPIVPTPQNKLTSSLIQGVGAGLLANALAAPFGFGVALLATLGVGFGMFNFNMEQK